ncbi:MAG: hypothetical protein JW806_03110 [Sedimentisphaerales bacterium]|nr:hypothetical protein [Sedimentisphaerales bacterium]
MANTENPKAAKSAPKPFMTAGPTLHYSHTNVNGCYFLAICVYYIAAVFCTKLLTGGLVSSDLTGPFYLEKLILSPLSIFEYPAQIFVLGSLVGIFIAVPILASQLMSFKYSILFILILYLIAGLPGLAIFVLLGSVAAALRPLRFRSRYIAIVLCMSPVFIYFIFFGGVKNADIVQWALSFAPWLYGLLTALAIAAIVIVIGHFTRYRPGLVWSTAAVFLIITIVVFQKGINLAELDYQLYVAKNNPEAISEFQDHSITRAIDLTVTNPGSRSYFQPPFYPAETIALRAVLKKEIQNRLMHDRWPEWLDVPDELKYQEKKQQLLEQYENFLDPQKHWFKPAFLHKALLNTKVRTNRIPIALYYKAMLSELSPELNMLVDKEILHFYNDYPHKENLPIWHRLFSKYPNSTESIEARWRRAFHLAGMEQFSFANQLIDEALKMAERESIKMIAISTDEPEKIFRKPQTTVITEFELKKIQRKLEYLQHLISSENLGNDDKTPQLLAQFILLNPHDPIFEIHLENLLQQAGEKSPLIDNILLAQTMLTPDAVLREQRLGQLADKYPGTDGGIQAKFEQACLKLSIWKEHDLSETEKQAYLVQAREDLENFLKNHPDSIYADQASEKLSALPSQ